MRNGKEKRQLLTLQVPYASRPYIAGKSQLSAACPHLGSFSQRHHPRHVAGQGLPLEEAGRQDVVAGSKGAGEGDESCSTASNQSLIASSMSTVDRPGVSGLTCGSEATEAAKAS